MRRRLRLLNQHLEGISWRVVEFYPEILRTLIRRRAGLYALYSGHRLYYVGLASNLMGRLNGHIRDRHRGLWDRFSVYLTTDDQHTKELESLILRIVKPAGNRVTGKFTGSDSLYRSVYRLMQDADADRRAVILGGHVAERRRQLKASKRKGSMALAGISERSTRLRAHYEGKIYHARLRRDGTILYAHHRYESPSAAAAAVVHGAANGWQFWRYRNDADKWVPLSTMRK